MNVKGALADYFPDGLIPASVMPSLFQGTTAQTWAALRHKGYGPAYVKVMRRVTPPLRCRGVDRTEPQDPHRPASVTTTSLPADRPRLVVT